ncbi:MAG TPA: restriction endonuclease [Longimicrobium sp.]
MPHWKEFEKLIARLHAAALPNVKVEHDVRLRGQSGRDRQIDVLLTTNVGFYPVRIAIECKKERRLIGIGAVGEFAEKLGDVGIAQGVMVARGFDSGAKAAADRHFIRLLSYRDANTADWQNLLTSNWISLDQVRVEWTLLATLFENENVAGEIPLTALIVDESHGIGTLGNFFDSLRRDVAHNKALIGKFGLDIQPNRSWTLQWEQRCESVKGFHLEGVKEVREFIINLALASGHVIEENGTRQVRIAEMMSESLNVERDLAPHLGRTLTPEEYRARAEHIHTVSFDTPTDAKQIGLQLGIRM